ncbi:MAG: hypothetical protein ACC633_09605 [Anaerolineales bacterium]
MSNDETTATEVRKAMTAQAVPNVYILSGGINNWTDTFTTTYEEGFCGKITDAGDEELRYEFNAALGSNCPAAYPDHEQYEIKYEKKIKLDLKRAPVGGGCG